MTKDSLIISSVSVTSSTKFPWDHEDDDKSTLTNQNVTTTLPVQSSTDLTNVSITGPTVIPGKNMVARKTINVNIYETAFIEIIAPVVFVHRDQGRMNSSLFITFNMSGPNVRYLMD